MRALLLSLLLVFGLSATPARAADVIETISAQRVVDLLGQAGFVGAEIDADEDVLVNMQGYRVLILVGTYKGKNLSMRFALAGTKATHETVNQFDTEKRFGRAYLDRDGDPVLEADLDLEGGVTEARVVDYFRTYNQLMVHFLRAVL
ncbi:YbjN domain-containing protein [Pseudofulvimonas gallinarii]|jgi:hypothetical protein|uniref:Putative sensory transduction regulator n=1 Tax=Pseudofulvimonas gallinarii TaxID=634155 RepID=A0A4V2UWX3_9GAMM|nr:YbjN domain-containing protein [Pseudofulvimonas gallinarii]TCT01328.1 putative sensory transduction regulator [Pseudofulvimonas gallinarii]THD15171.1 hypothetical protein B1808_01455 [Pseudofulvimonas gallinarii]